MNPATLIEKLKGLVSDGEALKSLQATNESLTIQLSEAQEKIATYEVQLSEFQALSEKIVELETRPTAEALKEAEEINAEKVNAEAVRLISAQGHAPIAVVSEEITGASILEKYNAIEDKKERLAFFIDNKAAIRAEVDKN